jgi:hypothetical protein
LLSGEFQSILGRELNGIVQKFLGELFFHSFGSRLIYAANSITVAKLAYFIPNKPCRKVDSVQANLIPDQSWGRVREGIAGAPPAMGVRGYNPRKIFKITDARR